MYLPVMKYQDGIGKVTQVKFGGLNRTAGAGDGDLTDMLNLTSDHYPVLSVRPPRYLHKILADPGGIYAWDKLCWVDGEGFYYDGKRKGTVTRGQKVFGHVGAYIVILPDKAYYNLVTDTFGSLEARWSGQELYFGNGKLYEEEAAANRIRAEGIDWNDYFRAGDAVTISGCTVNPGNNMTPIIREIDGDSLYFDENIFTLLDGKEYVEGGRLQISRDVPDLKFVCENGGRLWGCTDAAYYCCCPNDPFNWNVYAGLDADAWTVPSGSAGAFTGVVAYKGYPAFFKEEIIHKVYGSVPSAFSVQDSATLGLAEGSAGSLAVAGEMLFYLNRRGIMAYGGGIPQPVCEAFGSEHYKQAVAGSDGLKYYVSMCDELGRWGLYVYDTQRRLWHKEDDTHALGFALSQGCLYMLNDKGEIWIVGDPAEVPPGCQPESAIAWLAEFADSTLESPNKKGVTKLQLRLELEPGARAQVRIQYDSDGRWHRFGRELGEGVKRSYYLPVIPRRCDHFRIRIDGVGQCKIHSMAIEAGSGSEYKTTGRRN